MNRKYVDISNLPTKSVLSDMRPRETFNLMMDAIDKGNIYHVQKIYENTSWYITTNREDGIEYSAMYLAFRQAIRQNKLAILKYLYGITGYPLDVFIKDVIATDNPKMLQFILENEKEYTVNFSDEYIINPNGTASKKKDPRDYIDPSINGNQLLKYAVEMEKDEIVKYLLTFPTVLDDPDLFWRLGKYKKYYVENFIVGTTMALKGIQTSQGQLPIHVVEDILQKSYNVEGAIGLQQTIDIISDIFDR